MMESKKVLVITNFGQLIKKDDLCFSVISCDIDGIINGTALVKKGAYNGWNININGYITFTAKGQTQCCSPNKMTNYPPLLIYMNGFTYERIKKGSKIITTLGSTIMVLPLYSLYSMLVKFANKHDHENIRAMKKRIAEELASEDFKKLFGIIKE